MEELQVLHLHPTAIEVPIDGPGDRRVCVTAGFGPDDRILYFHGHYDVVPAQHSDQFVPRIEGGKLTGRGSADMKSGVAFMIHVAAILRDLKLPWRAGLGLCLVPDEEIGGARGSGYLAGHGLLGRNAIGMLTAEPTGGVIWNGSRGAVSMRITVHGRTAHVGLAHSGINAFEGMLEVANSLRAVQAEIAERQTAFSIGPDVARRSILLLGGMAKSGTGFNVVPDRASFTLDRRTNPEEDLAAEKTRILEVIEEVGRQGWDIDVEVLQEGDASASSDDEPLALQLAAAVGAVTGSAPRFELCPGLLELRYYARLGIPAYAYGPGSLELAHQSAESVDLHEIRDVAAVYALTALEMLQTAPD
jgi:acetylornithine deacetylase/succinyl-diaminopimelate desuccinylase-like protein